MKVRPPAVAGRFYPADPNQLRDQVVQFLAAASVAVPGRPKALIVPHAGYVFSGPVAASGYAWMVPWSDQIERVVLLGTCHTPGVSGLASTSAEEFLTPLGRVPVDRAAVEESLRFTQVHLDDEAHDRDHALEVQLPFLQVVLDSFAIVPFLVGRADAETVAEILEPLWDGDRTLIVVSSDLSHQHPYEEAQAGSGDRGGHRATPWRGPWPEIRLRAKRNRGTIAHRQATWPELPDRRPPLLRRHRRPAAARGRLRILGLPPPGGLAAELIPAYRNMATKYEDPVNIGFVRESATAAERT